MQSEFIRFKANVKNILNNFIIQYCPKYNIKVDSNKLENYWFNKLCEELETILNTDNEIIQLLNKKETEYFSHPEYNIIKIHMSDIKKHVIKMYYNNYTNKDNILKHFDFRVAVALKIYHERLEIINNYKNLGSSDTFVINQIRLLEENIHNSHITFLTLENDLKKYLEEKNTNKKSEEKQSKILKVKKRKK